MSGDDSTASARRLALLRHAKAEHPEHSSDAERALTDRGLADAIAVGNWLMAQQLVPDMVLCSPARRARETWKTASTIFGDAAAGVTTVYEPRLYAAEADDLVELLTDTDPAVRVLLLVGHNPTLSMLSALLDPTAPTVGLRTSGLAVHRVPDDWSECAPGRVPLTATHTARA